MVIGWEQGLWCIPAYILSRHNWRHWYKFTGINQYSSWKDIGFFFKVVFTFMVLRQLGFLPYIPLVCSGWWLHFVCATLFSWTTCVLLLYPFASNRHVQPLAPQKASGRSHCPPRIEEGASLLQVLSLCSPRTRFPPKTLLWHGLGIISQAVSPSGA